MKKTIAIILLLAMTAMLFACATEPEAPVEPDDPAVSDTEGPDTDEATDAPITDYESGEVIPVEDGTEFYFSSGASAWYTSVVLNSDGSFEGEYSDFDASGVDENSPNGCYYVADFKGKFTNIKKLNDYSYSMTLEYVETEKPAGEEWIEDGTKYIAADAHGISGEEFILYLPETPASETNADFLTWWRDYYQYSDENGEISDSSVTLGCYAIRNLTENFGFFAY
ncbi:MAG: hypothetical protein IKT46_03675 [Clostridia bacterium]|nr:hypothetical protein [Clostridia bacterium]